MKRISFILVFLCLFMICSPLFSFAVSNPAPVVDSVLTEPVPSFVLGSDYDTYVQYLVTYRQSDSSYVLREYTLYVPHGHTLNLEIWTAWQWTWTCDTSFSCDCNNYNLVNGSIMNIYTDVQSVMSYSKQRISVGIQGQFPNNGGNCSDAYSILSPEVNLVVSNTSFYSGVPFVNWSPVIPYVHSYSSYLSEPIADPYNRYIVLAGEDQQYIYLLSFSLSDLTMFNSQSVNQGADEVDLTYNNVFTPVIMLDNNQLKLQLDIDPQIFYILNNTDDHLYKYNIMFAKYNLVDGQYISSSLYSGTITSATTSLAFDFGSYDDYDSIKTYGVQYIDNLNSQWHYNMLHCSWGHDPDFESWQENVLFYLQGIYNSLVDDSGDSVPTTNPAVESQVDSYVSEEHSYMQSFDSAGTTVDVVFSEAESRMSSSSNAFEFLTDVFNNFVFGFDIPYIVLFISMTFGFVLLIIGRKMGA